MRNHRAAWTALAALALTLSCGLFRAGAPQCLITEPDLLPFLDQPRLDAALVTVVRKGTAVRLLEDRRSAETIRLGRNDYGHHWYRVETAEGKTGWVPAVALELVVGGDGYRLVAGENRLRWYDAAGTLRATSPLPASKEGPIARLAVQAAGPALVVFGTPHDRPYATYVGVFDRKSFRFIGRVPECSTCLGASPDGKYLAFDDGTGETGRELFIFSLQRKQVVHRSRPHRIHGWGKPGGVWLADGGLEFDTEVERVPRDLPDIDDSCRYVRVHRFKDGRVRATDRYVTACGE